MNAELIAAIEAALQQRSSRREGNEAKFRCVAHEPDDNPSARWNPTKHVWHCDVCGAGGGAYDLARRLGIDIPSGAGLSVADLADAKGLPVELLHNVGVTDGIAGRSRTPCVDIPWVDLAGEVVGVHKRLRLNGEPRFIWRTDDKVREPYGLSVLQEAQRVGYVLWDEGETDVWTCRHTGISALGVPGASNFKAEWAKYTEGIARVFVWQEPGQGGRTFAEKVAAAIPDVRVIVAPDDAKDPNALWLISGLDLETFRRRMRDLMDAARPASELRREAESQEAREAYELAAHLIESPDLFHRVCEAIRALGYAGELHPPLIAYFAITSRLLVRPLNANFLAPSGAGKSRAVDDALTLMPPSAYHIEKAGSSRALIYNNADYQHRAVVVAEADSIPQDEGPAASAIRALAADNYMAYDVVEQDDNGRQSVRHIVKPGPTGLITTSVRPLRHQLNTRMLEVAVPDTPEQTRRVMFAHAASVNGAVPDFDPAPFVAMQIWLALAGVREVTVPFAHTLAELVSNREVRMRRDYRQLLTGIQAVALLYQRQRERDGRGRIIATADDYAYARELLLAVFETATTGGVTATVRQTVQAAEELYDGENPVTVQAVANRLQLAKDTTLHRVRRAIGLGYLVNDEKGRGRPAKLRPGDLLPDDRPSLPTVEEVFGSSDPDPPDPGSTIQPYPDGQSYAESEGGVEDGVESAIQPDLQPLDDEGAEAGVESGVESGIQPDFQPSPEADPDSASPDPGVRVEGLNGDPGKGRITNPSGPCPDCGYTAVPVHRKMDGRTLRWLADRGNPIAQKALACRERRCPVEAVN